MSMRNTPAGKILADRFSGHDGCMLFEVPDATGFNKNRTADGISMGFWPSRGLLVEGYEYKCQRGDWLKELKSPAKADGFYARCDLWWLVTSDDKIAKLEEIPEGWGWCAMKKSRLAILKKATRNQNPTFDRNFLAGLLRSATRGDKKRDAEELRSLRHEGWMEGDKFGRQQMEKECNHHKERAEQAEKILNELEQNLGVRIAHKRFGYGRALAAEDVGRILKDIMNGKYTLEEGYVQNVRRVLSQINAGLDEFQTLARFLTFEPIKE